MWLKRLTLLFLFTVILLPSFAFDESGENRSAISYLKGLQIEDLINVEVVLDDVFDVFDGLIKARKTTIATGEIQSTSRAPSVTTVITAQDIEAIGARDLDDVLATVPGLHVSMSGLYNKSDYTIRGMRSSNNLEVLILVNWVPMTTTYEEERGIILSSMPINMISRLEVIRGPGSAVYGADAYSGVINIITKNADEIKGTEVGTRVGSFNTHEGWALHGGHWKGFDIAAGLEYRKSDGQDSTIQADAQTQFDKLFGTDASLAPGPVNTGIDNLDVRLDIKKGFWQARAGYQGRNDLGTGPGVGQALDPVGYINSARTNADFIYHHPTLTPFWDVTAQFSYIGNAFEDHFVIYPPGAFGGAYPDGFIGIPGATDRTLRLDTFAFYSGFHKHLLRIGVGYSHFNQYKVTEDKNFGIDPATGQPLPPGSPIISVTGTPYAANKKAQRESKYLSLQDVWRMTDGWELTAGIRYDDYSDFGRTINPRLALMWQPTLGFTSKLLYGRAFRAPSFLELYNANNPVQQGNPDLKPDIINTWELAFDYRAKENLHLAANLFHYKATDKIQLAPIPGAEALIYQNIGVLEGNGLELEARWKTSKWSSLLANYSYVKVTDEIINHDTGNYPRHTAYVRTDWLLIPNYYLDLQAKWVSDRQRVLGDPRSPVADYTTVDLTLRYKDIRGGRANLALGVRNLFNADAREPSLGPDSSGMIGIPYDLPLAKRSWFVEFRYRF